MYTWVQLEKSAETKRGSLKVRRSDSEKEVVPHKHSNDLRNYRKSSGGNSLSVLMFSKQKWLKNLSLICKNKADLTWLNLLQSQLKALCQCRWSSIFPPHWEATKMGAHCPEMASRGQNWSWDCCHPQGCLMMPEEWEEDGQWLLLLERQCTSRHSPWLIHLGPHAWQ